MQSQHNIIKKLSSVHVKEELKTDPAPRHVVERAYISSPEKEWVFKELKTNPAFIKAKEESDDEDAKDYEKAGEDKNGLFDDVVACEYMSFMSCRAEHARVVVDEKQQLAGKLSSYIPNLKTWWQLVEKEIEKVKDELKKEFVPATNKIMIKALKKFWNELMEKCDSSDVLEGEELSKMTKEMSEISSFLSEKGRKYTGNMSLDKVPLDKIANKEYFKLLLQESVLSSFAQSIVFIQRLGIKDITNANIGIDGNNRVVLFDADHSFEDEGVDLDLHKVPKTRIFEKDNDDITNELKDFLGKEKYELFQRQQYRFWLKELLCPEKFIRTLSTKHAIPEMLDEANRIKFFLLRTRVELEEKLLKEPGFVAYLRAEGSKDYEVMMEEFKRAQQLHHYYADPILLAQVENNYKNLVEGLSPALSAEKLVEVNGDAKAEQVRSFRMTA